jgi:hypothetical protein
MWETIVSFIVGTICAALIIRWCSHCAQSGRVDDMDTQHSTVEQHRHVEQRRPVSSYTTRVQRSPSDLAAMATVDALIRDALIRDRYSMYAPSNKVQTPKNNPMPMKRKKVIPTNQECSICLDPISENAIQCCKCGHCFHEECIKRWLKKNPTCPLCRQKCGLTF